MIIPKLMLKQDQIKKPPGSEFIEGSPDGLMAS